MLVRLFVAGVRNNKVKFLKFLSLFTLRSAVIARIVTFSAAVDCYLTAAKKYLYIFYIFFKTILLASLVGLNIYLYTYYFSNISGAKQFSI